MARCAVFYSFGVWLSLVERYVRDVEVACSNPVTPTIKSRMAFAILLFIICVQSPNTRLPKVPNTGRRAKRSGGAFCGDNKSYWKPQWRNMRKVLDIFVAIAAEGHACAGWQMPSCFLLSACRVRTRGYPKSRTRDVGQNAPGERFAAITVVTCNRTGDIPTLLVIQSPPRSPRATRESRMAFAILLFIFAGHGRS